MRIGSILAIYFLVWWTALFAVLPIGARSQAEEESVLSGTDPGAPVRPFLLRKIIATSLIAALLTAALIYVGHSGFVRLEDLPMPFKTDAY